MRVKQVLHDEGSILEIAKRHRCKTLKHTLWVTGEWFSRTTLLILEAEIVFPTDSRAGGVSELWPTRSSSSNSSNLSRSIPASRLIHAEIDERSLQSYMMIKEQFQQLDIFFCEHKLSRVSHNPTPDSDRCNEGARTFSGVAKLTRSIPSTVVL